jgi:hypothetical protein
MAIPFATKYIQTVVPVTVISGAQTGSSAANPDLTSPCFVAGIWPTGIATSTGWGLIDTVVLNADGSVTVTTRAVVATQNLTVGVLIARAVNS